MSSGSATGRHAGAGQQKKFFSLKTKELSSAAPVHRKNAPSSQGGYGRMLVLGKGRPGAPSGGQRSKMAVPKPVNLPSLKAETGAMAPSASATSGASTSSWSTKAAPEDALQEGGMRSAWGDSPSPAGPGVSRLEMEFPALGKDDGEGRDQRLAGHGVRGREDRTSSYRGGDDSAEYDRREWGNLRSGPGGGDRHADRYGRSPPDERGGGWYTGSYRSAASSSPPRVEPGAIMIKKRVEGEQRAPASGTGLDAPPRGALRDQNDSNVGNRGQPGRPMVGANGRATDAFTASPTTANGSFEGHRGANGDDDDGRSLLGTGNYDDDDGDVFTPDQGQIVWSLEAEEMDFSRPLRFGDEDEDDQGSAWEDPPAAAEVADEKHDDEEETYVPRQDIDVDLNLDEEDPSSSRGGHVDERNPDTKFESGSAGDAVAMENADGQDTRELTQDEILAEQAALEERRRQIMERREEELRRMRALEEEREARKRELDRLRQEEDERRQEDEIERRRHLAERGDTVQRDIGRGVRGEVRTLFNPKDPDRPIIVKPGEQVSQKRPDKADGKKDRNRNRDRDRDRERERDSDRDRERARDRPAVEQSSSNREPYRSSRSLVPDQPSDKKSSRIKGGGGAATAAPLPSSSSSGQKKEARKADETTKKDKKKKKDEKKPASAATSTSSADGAVPAAVVPAPAPAPAPVPAPEPVWEKPLMPQVKTLAEIQQEEEQRELEEAARKIAAAREAANPAPQQARSNKPSEQQKKKKDQKEKKTNKQQKRKDDKAAMLSKQSNRDAAPLRADNKSSVALDSTAPGLAGGSSVFASMETSALSALAPLMPVLDAPAPVQQRRLFERGHEDDELDSFHLERSIDAVTEEGLSSLSSTGPSQSRTRFTESAIAASAFTPKFGLTPLPDPTFQSTWAPQTSQLDSEAESNARYTGLFGAPSSVGQASPFAPTFGSSGYQWGSADGARPLDPTAASRFFPSESNVSGGPGSSSLAPLASTDTWSTPSVFALPPHIMDSSQAVSRPVAVSAPARQPLMVKSDPEEFGKFLERATFTPQSKQYGSAAPLSAAEPSIGGKPLSTLAATPPAYILGGGSSASAPLVSLPTPQMHSSSVAPLLHASSSSSQQAQVHQPAGTQPRGPQQHQQQQPHRGVRKGAGGGSGGGARSNNGGSSNKSGKKYYSNKSSGSGAGGSPSSGGGKKSPHPPK